MLVLVAAVCMLIQDILGVLLVDAESRGHGWMAGGLDSASWLLAIATTTISVTALQGHSLGQKAEVLVAVSAANVIGSRLGVYFGERFVARQKDS